ncbi:MAG: tRNA adenosine(34) deaminase TadA [Phototrophicales bacterium]|nr:MAG: tRNA adenosine(34) deaminase TadA [Phototrophicales bacterium]
MDDQFWMRIALHEAESAMHHGDVPVGAVAVHRNRIIAIGRNQREQANDPTAHAEILAMRAAAHVLGHWRLEEVTLYCTLEPCPMCAGAMVLARLPRLVFATTDPKGGAGGSVMNILSHPSLNHRVEVSSGVLQEEAATLLRKFFARLRAEGQK